ncbi:MAG: VOC family protein [Candidatus Bathyarchaeota archaeon]|nr:VOC family protein [Candidatus Bathyarchaeota archaeon]
MKASCFDHIHSTVKDLSEAVAFYKRLGINLVGRLDHGGDSVQVSYPGGMIVNLHLAKATDNLGYNHFAMTVEDLDTAVEGLKGQGTGVDGPVDVQATGRRLAAIKNP